MKTKVLNNEFIYNNQGADASQIVELTHDTWRGFKKFKFTYDSGNAYEHFKIEVIDSKSGQLHPIASITDLGIKPDRSAYNLLNQYDTEARVNMIMAKGYKYIKLLY